VCWCRQVCNEAPYNLVIATRSLLMLGLLGTLLLGALPFLLAVHRSVGLVRGCLVIAGSVCMLNSLHPDSPLGGA
jgi:hypothetical protein